MAPLILIRPSWRHAAPRGARPTLLSRSLRATSLPRPTTTTRPSPTAPDVIEAGGGVDCGDGDEPAPRVVTRAPLLVHASTTWTGISGVYLRWVGIIVVMVLCKFGWDSSKIRSIRDCYLVDWNFGGGVFVTMSIYFLIFILVWRSSFRERYGIFNRKELFFCKVDFLWPLSWEE